MMGLLVEVPQTLKWYDSFSIGLKCKQCGRILPRGFHHRNASIALGRKNSGVLVKGFEERQYLYKVCKCGEAYSFDELCKQAEMEHPEEWARSVVEEK